MGLAKFMRQVIMTIDPHSEERAYQASIAKYYARPSHPGNQWLFATPLPEVELEELRIKAMAFHATAGEFTCHGCKLAQICCLVYDSYNTQGDCLLSK